MKKVDYLVIGSGIAGLSLALKVAKHGTVCVITKSREDETNTKYAQGGVAVVIDQKDSFSKHIEDTLIAGDGLCDEDIVKMVVTEAPSSIKEIIEYGTNFDKTYDGNFDLAKEGGHSAHRVLHYKDVTGAKLKGFYLIRYMKTLI